MSAKRVRVEQVRSAIGYTRAQRATLRGLGLRRIGSVVEVERTPAIDGMLKKVHHLVRVEER